MNPPDYCLRQLGMPACSLWKSVTLPVIMSLMTVLEDCRAFFTYATRASRLQSRTLHANCSRINMHHVFNAADIQIILQHSIEKHEIYLAKDRYICRIVPFEMSSKSENEPSVYDPRIKRFAIISLENDCHASSTCQSQ